MKRLALATALATSLAAPAFAEGHTTAFAILHFNMSADNTGEIIMDPRSDIMMADLTMGSTLSEVFRILNLDADNMSELRGQGDTVTVIMSNPSFATDVFERLRAADDDN